MKTTAKKAVKYTKKRPFILWVGIPVLITGLYLGAIAQNRYVSESKIVVKQAGHSGTMELSLGSILGGSSGSLREDAMILREHILSPDMLDKITKDLPFKKAYEKAGLDWWNQLPANPSKEELLEYYRKRVSASFDDKTGMLVLKTEGFTPDFSQKLNKTILSESEQFINELSHKISRDEMAFARAEVDRAYQEVNLARENLLTYQNKNGVLDPMARAEAASKMVAEMEAKQAIAEAELKNLQTYLNDDTPQVVAAKNALSSLRSQIAEEKKKISAPEDGRLNRKAAQFAELKAKLDFSTDLYKVTLATFEKARVDTGRKQKSLAVIAAPNLPEEAEYPKKLYTLLSLIIGLSLIYGLIRMMMSVIEDHRT